MVSVPKLLEHGGTVVCIGGGPSLTPADVDACRGRATVIAVNDAYRLAPWAEVLYACDQQWWQWHQGVPSFAGHKFGLQPKAAKFAGVQILRNTGETGLELDPTGVRTGKNSGYQAINVAVHLGASRIVLLGYDMQRGTGGAHWFGSHPSALQPPLPSFVPMFKHLVKPLAALGISIVNCSRATALTCFPRATLDAALLERAA